LLSKLEQQRRELHGLEPQQERAGRLEPQRGLPPPRSSAVRAVGRGHRNRPLSGSAQADKWQHGRLALVASANAPGYQIMEKEKEKPTQWHPLFAELLRPLLHEHMAGSCMGDGPHGWFFEPL
jgi:hypothetical protein